MTYTIRRLSADDLAGFRAIRLDALKDSPEAFGSSYEETRAQPDSYFAGFIDKLAVFGAFAGNGEQMGVVAFARRTGVKGQHAGDMISMYVRPEMRGTGCALRLIETLLDHARGEVIQVHLGVGTYNAPAIRLYQKAGFEIYGTEPRALFVNGRYIDEHQMVRFLDKAPGVTK